MNDYQYFKDKTRRLKKPVNIFKDAVLAVALVEYFVLHKQKIVKQKRCDL